MTIRAAGAADGGGVQPRADEAAAGGVSGVRRSRRACEGFRTGGFLRRPERKLPRVEDDSARSPFIEQNKT